MGIGDLVLGNAVDEGHERAALVLVSRQRGHYCEADFLSDVVG
jgi:hypothetical protein